MKNNRFLQVISTKYIILTLIILVTLVFLICWYIIKYSEQNITTINKIVDLALKALVILFGFIWFLNRYYIERKDFHKFDTKLDFNSILINSRNYLLIYRIDIYNKGNILFDNYLFFMQIDGFQVKDEKIIVEKIQNLPESKELNGLPIEPDSWFAINNELIISSEFKAIRFYYSIKKNEEVIWTWHKTYKLNTVTNTQ